MALPTANRSTPELEKKMQQYRDSYTQWKTNKVGFFPIFNSFKDTHLKDISGGALKAYIYFGLHAKNNTGESWHSIETMSEYFEVDIRTIKKWVKELEDRKLIARIQKGYKRTANTFLIPYDSKD